MKSVVVFVVTAFCALTIGAFAGTAAAEDGSAGCPGRVLHRARRRQRLGPLSRMTWE